MRRMAEAIQTSAGIKVEVFIRDGVARPVLLISDNGTLVLTVDEALHLSAKLTAAGLLAEPSVPPLCVVEDDAS